MSLKVGTTCGLTDKKPSFNKTCIHIALNHKFESKLESINVELYLLKKQKVEVYLNSLAYIALGICIVVIGLYFGDFIYSGQILRGKFSAMAPIIIIGSAVGPIFLGINKLSRYLQSYSVAKSKKANLDEVLNTYRITYDIHMKLGENIHGTQEVWVDLKTKGVR